MVWNWLDQHGERFGLRRPLGHVDPAHVQPRRSWHETAAMLRNQRLAGTEGTASSASSEAAETEPVEPLVAASPDDPSAAGITQEQFNCVRPHPPDDVGDLRKAFKRFHPLVSRVAAAADKKPAKAKWRTAGGAAIHRINPRRPADDAKHPAENAKHNPKGKGRLHLAG